MPEGDTVHKLARALRPVLAGRELHGVWQRDRGVVAALAGRRVHEVATLGKHMLPVLRDGRGRAADDRVIHVHLGMHGRWERREGGTSTRARTDALPDAALEALFRRAARLLRWNLGGWRRTTTRPVRPDAPLAATEPRHWVYGRANAPCLRCGAWIAAGRVGDAARATYWCPRCQPTAAGVRLTDAPTPPGAGTPRSR